MNPLAILRLATATAIFTASPVHLANAWEPLRVHPQNPYITEFRGQATLLRTFGQHYSAVVDSNFNYVPYLNVLQRDGMNLTRVWPLGFPADAPATAAQFIEPWLRSSAHGNALDGQGKWDFSTWNEAYFIRLDAFVQACSDRGIVAEITLFSTFYNDNQWRASPFHPSNNIQGYGPANRYDCLRPVDANLLAVQTTAIQRIVTTLNHFDNIYFETDNEPFWNEPLVRDSQDVEFNNQVLGIIHTAESRLPKRHLVAHNFPQQIANLALDFEVINEHYPTTVVIPAPNPGIAGGDSLLRNHYSRGKILALDETDTTSALATRLESWMFLLGGGGIYNGLDSTRLVYTQGNISGDNAQGNATRKAVRDIATYIENLHFVALRRNLSWVTAGIPTGASLQAMANPGQQYVAYFHHAQTRGTFQLEYNLIDSSNHSIAPVVLLDPGTWRAVWTRPVDMVELSTETFDHGGGIRTLAPVSYQEDIALRIDRTGDGDTTPPPTPTGFSSQSNLDPPITLSWNPVSAADLASYHIYRATNTGFPIDTAHLIAVLPATGIRYLDTSTVVGTTYNYLITALDLSGNPSNASREINATSGTVAATNTAPQAKADSYSTYQNTPLVIPAFGVLNNDTDQEFNPLTATLNSSPIHGSINLKPNGGFSYTPTTNYTGTDSFTYHANDGNLDSNNATVTLRITPQIAGALISGSFESGFTGWKTSGNLFIQSAAPWAASDGSRLVAFNSYQKTPNGIISQSFATTAGQTYTLAFDAGILAFNTNSQIMQVTVTSSTNRLTQTITLAGLDDGINHWYPQKFSFVADSSSATLTFMDKSTATNSLDLLLDKVSVTEKIIGPNTAPIALPDIYSTTQDSSLEIIGTGVLSNDSDAQFDPLTAEINTASSHGSVILNPNGSFRYTPSAGYSGIDSFTYHASDGNLVSNVVTVMINIHAIPPILLINGSFEAGFSGWTATGNLFIQSSAPWAANDGAKLLAYNSYDRPPNGVISQSFATTVGQTYILAFDAGVLARNTNSQILRATVTGFSNLLSQTITLNGVGGAINRWFPQNFTFTADSTSATLTFQDQSTATNSIDLLLDHVQILTSTPILGAFAPTAPANHNQPISPATRPWIVSQPAILGLPSLTGTPDSFSLSMTAKQPGIYILEKSNDLKTWNYVSEIYAITQDLMEFHSFPNPSTQESVKNLFHRIKFQPDSH